MRIEIQQPRPRLEDWRIRLDGRAVGHVWRAGHEYVVTLLSEERYPDRDQAFDAARRQARKLAKLG